MANGQRVGYVRVSSADQNTERQLEGIQLDRCFTDKASGKDTARPQLEAMLQFVREGDTVIVHSMDRLARNLGDLRSLVERLTKHGITVRFEKESLEFTNDKKNPTSMLLLSMLGAVAEFERDMIRERQREGIAIAKAKGVYKGRKPSLNFEQANELRRRIAAGEPKATLAREFGISRETLYQYARVTL